MKKSVIVAATVIGLGAIAGGGIAVAASSGGNPDPVSEQNAEASYTADHEADAAVTRDEAIATATNLHPGKVSDVHLENEGAGLRWEVKPDDGTWVWEVQVDAATGKVVSDHHDDTN